MARSAAEGPGGTPTARADRPVRVPDDPDATPTTGPDGRWTGARIGIWLAVSRVVAGLVVAHGALVLLPSARLRSPFAPSGPDTWLGGLDRWDALHYLSIAAHGYPSGQPWLRAFFPVYPLVVRLVVAATGDTVGYLAAGCLVSVTCFTVAGGLLYRLVATRSPGAVALVATALFCWFPTSLFYLAPYPEALFALEILAVATLIDRERWWWAAGVAGIASATSPESVALTVALVVAALVARRGIRRVVGYAALGSSGAIAYTAYLGIRFGSPFGYTRALHAYHRVAVVPLVGTAQNLVAVARQLVGHTPVTPDGATGATGAAVTSWRANVLWMWVVDDLAVLLALAALAALAAVVLRRHRGRPRAGDPRVPVAWLVLLAGIVVVATSTVIHAPGGPVSTEAAGRLVMVAFPLFLGLALIGRRWPGALIVGMGLSVGAALVTQALFALGYWVT